jgi:hypothetical protein
MREIYPEPLNENDWIACVGKRPHFSYLHYEANEKYFYDIFTCNDVMMEHIEGMSIGDECQCVIVCPFDKSHIPSVAICVQTHYRHGSCVYVCFSDDQEGIDHAREEATNKGEF